MKKPIFILLTSILLISGCNFNDVTIEPSEPSDPVVPHEHTYSDTWSSDESYHWYAATCEHTDEYIDKEDENTKTLSLKR